MGFLNFLVYAGIWGYNGVLAMPCISCVFYAFGKMSFLLGLVDTIAVGFAQYALRATMTLQVGKYMFPCPQILKIVVFNNFPSLNIVSHFRVVFLYSLGLLP